MLQSALGRARRPAQAALCRWISWAKAEVTEEAVAKFGVLMRQRIQEGETPARKAWLRSIIDRIEVAEGAIRLFGRKDVLEQCVMAGTVATPGVRTFVPEWRAGKEPTNHDDSET